MYECEPESVDLIAALNDLNQLVCLCESFVGLLPL